MGWKRRLAIATVAIVGIYAVFQIATAVAATAYAGTSPPLVVVESNSMMHVDEAEYDEGVGDLRAEGVPFGRVGTLDPGDLLLVQAVDDVTDVATVADGGEQRYGAPGDVVQYFPGGDRAQTPVVHRAMTYVEVVPQDEGPTRYEVRWHEDWDRNVGCADESDANCTQPGDCDEDEHGRLSCTFEHGFRLPALLHASGTHVYSPDRSGFLTQGDNPNNEAPDQAIPGFDRGPIPVDWIHGVVRAELPWLGLTELATEGDPATTAGVEEHPYAWTIGGASAPRDLWIGAFTVTGLWWGLWLGGCYLAYRYVRHDELPWREPDEPETVGFDPVSPGDPGQRS